MRSRRRHQESPVPPLWVSLQRTVRFEEVDAMGIMWHGRYASWLEDGREILGKTFGIHYLDFYGQQVAIPVKIFHVDYNRPLLYNQSYTVHTGLVFSEAALLDIEYRITDHEGQLMTRAWTTQLMVSLSNTLLLEQPEFFRLFRARWLAGDVPQGSKGEGTWV